MASSKVSFSVSSSGSLSQRFQKIEEARRQILQVQRGTTVRAGPPPRRGARGRAQITKVSRGRGGRGRGRGRVSKEVLDRQLDSYLLKDEESAKDRLDADLDAYMAVDE